jgi:hypothetical protein
VLLGGGTPFFGELPASGSLIQRKVAAALLSPIRIAPSRGDRAANPWRGRIPAEPDWPIRPGSSKDARSGAR